MTSVQIRYNVLLYILSKKAAAQYGGFMILDKIYSVQVAF